MIYFPEKICFRVETIPLRNAGTAYLVFIIETGGKKTYIKFFRNISLFQEYVNGSFCI